MIKKKLKRQSPEVEPPQLPLTANSKGSDLKTNSLITFQEELNGLESDRARNIDDLALHDELLGGILGAIKDDLKSGLPADKILGKYAALAAARTVTIAATDADSSRALAASKDILDRVQGKATENKKITHKLESVDADQLDALLLSEIDSLEVEYSDVTE